MLGTLFIDLERGRLGDGIVVADRFDDAAIARRAALGGDDAVARSLLGAHTLESKSDHEMLLPALNARRITNHGARAGHAHGREGNGLPA